ncbi:hypothetical protein AGMMS50256_35110 [Betaproteobacteria bacterium]|nr:hypothetical protein AGMMS50256_35110 [Betaproteobacteria bacterium]
MIKLEIMNDPAASYGVSNPQKTSSYYALRGGELNPERLKKSICCNYCYMPSKTRHTSVRAGTGR